MSRSRRPSVSIYDYPEHLNPFSDDIGNSRNHQMQSHLYQQEGKSKDTKHKFWTFGRSRKKRSNSFSIKSTWNGLFGKRKEDKSDMQEKRSTITTVSTTYKREPYVKPAPSPQATRDQQEFDEALGTLARRRKYTLDNSASRYGSSLTVNGDPARLYDGSPQDTTASIMGDLTPKPPARRFGQVSPKPTDKIPPLDFDSKSPKENGSVTVREKTPIPPLRRFGNRASQRTNASTLEPEEDACRSVDTTICDENENVPSDYMFKRCSQDPVRRSNLSINSCVSVASTMSTYGRKKRRAPQPPRRVENAETKEEKIPEVPAGVELRIVEPMDIARVAENIDEMTRKSKELDKDVAEVKEVSAVPNPESPAREHDSPGSQESNSEAASTTNEARPEETESPEKEQTEETESSSKGADEEEERKVEEVREEETKRKDDEEVQVEYRRSSQENIEIIKDVEQGDSDEVCLRRKGSTGSLSRSDSFSVKEEIEKIERQIKALETRNASCNGSEERNENGRLSIHETRRHFFQNLVDEDNGKSGIKIEFKEFPREQKDIHVVRLNDSPVPTVASREPVKVIELHISEPIRQKPEILEDVNPIPKPRRHSSMNLNATLSTRMSPRESRRSLDSSVRGKSF